MARIRTGQKRASTSWKEFIDGRIRVGKALPIISHALISHTLFGDYPELLRDYATYLDYPDLPMPGLPRLTQFSSITEQVQPDTSLIKHNYLNWVKSRLFELAEKEKLPAALLEEAEALFDELDFQGLCHTLGYPRFGDPREDPFLVLAQLPLPIFITTGYHGMVEAALTRVGKSPRSQTCLWSPHLRNLPSVWEDNYQPSVAEPLVFYLLGQDRYPDSLVLTQDNYMEFLVNVSREMGRQTDLIPPCLRHALTDASLILLDYDLDAWEFRILYWSLLQQRGRKHTSVSVLKPEPDDPEKDYKSNYLRSSAFEVYWGDLNGFTHDFGNVSEGR